MVAVVSRWHILINTNEMKRIKFHSFLIVCMPVFACIIILATSLWFFIWESISNKHKHRHTDKHTKKMPKYNCVHKTSLDIDFRLWGLYYIWIEEISSPSSFSIQPNNTSAHTHLTTRYSLLSSINQIQILMFFFSFFSFFCMCAWGISSLFVQLFKFDYY